MARFTGRAALVTGAAGGIGRATVTRLAGEGAAVALLDRDAAALAEAAEALRQQGAKALGLEADVVDAAAVAEAIGQAERALGGLDILVNNAAYTMKGRFAEVAPEDWDVEVDVTLKGPYLCARAALPGMVARGKGAIVNIGSVNALMAFGNPAYSAAKAGLLNLTQSLAVEYGRRGIRTNMVSPGSVRTQAPSWMARLEKDPRIFEKLARWYPVGRVGEPEDIAAAVAFLASDDAAFVNGANLVVDGGLTAGMTVMIDELAQDQSRS